MNSVIFDERKGKKYMDATKGKVSERAKWHLLRTLLKQSYDYDNNWNEAIELFNQRIEQKYFQPIQEIIDKKTLKGEGFAIVTIQCALIEMFASFRLGKIFNFKKNKDSLEFEYKSSQELFSNFLKTAVIFENIFWQKNAMEKPILNQPFNSNDFYSDVRCGLMHEARTKANWHIKAAPKKGFVKTDSIFLVRENENIIIYRTVLHYRLKKYLEDYSNELRSLTQEGNDLRRFFARKMDHLFDHINDPDYEWWTP